MNTLFIQHNTKHPQTQNSAGVVVVDLDGRSCQLLAPDARFNDSGSCAELIFQPMSHPKIGIFSAQSNTKSLSLSIYRLIVKGDFFRL